MVVPQRLYRNRSDRMLAGVSGGVGQYFGIDPTVVRLFLVLAAIFSGGLIIPVYLVMWLVVPEEPVDHLSTATGQTFGTPGSANPGEAPDAPPSWSSTSSPSDFGTFRWTSDEQRRRRTQWIGWGLLILGFLILVSNLHLLSWLQLNVTWPFFLILAGFFLLFRQRRSL
jgi:phage shock protein C